MSKMFKTNYSPGICPHCKEEFTRFGIRMGEEESFHIKGHRLDEIEKYINETTDAEFDYFSIYYDLENIFNISCLAYNRHPRYKKRADRCRRLMEKAHERFTTQ